MWNTPFQRNAIPLTGNDKSQSQPSIPEAVCDDESASASNTPTSSFAPEQIDLYKLKKRYEEGYNIYDDQQYVAWLCLNYPGAALHNNRQLASLLQEFSHVTQFVSLPTYPASPPSASSALQLTIA